MDVTIATWIVGVAGLMLMGLLIAVQAVAIVRPRAPWTIANIYGGHPDDTDPEAYFAYNQGYAWADVFFWGPLQIVASIGMLLGQQWGFVLGLVASAPWWYTAITIFIWDRDLGFRKEGWAYWVIWGVFPVFGVIQGLYCSFRLLV